MHSSIQPLVGHGILAIDKMLCMVSEVINLKVSPSVERILPIVTVEAMESNVVAVLDIINKRDHGNNGVIFILKSVTTF